MRLIYIDDSGDEACVMFSALMVPDFRWSSYLKSWQTWRKTLYRQHEVPPSYELHSQDWLSASPKPADLTDLNKVEITRKSSASRALRFEVFEKSLRTIGSFTDAELLTIHGDGTQKYDLYRELLKWIEEHLEEVDDLGIVIVDGLDQGLHYRECHRELDIRKRRIIEDPTEMHSHGSHWIQMADLCVHAAFQAVKQNPRRHENFQRAYAMSLSRIIVKDVGQAEHGIRYIN